MTAGIIGSAPCGIELANSMNRTALVPHSITAPQAAILIDYCLCSVVQQWLPDAAIALLVVHSNPFSQNTHTSARVQRRRQKFLNSISHCGDFA